MTEHKCECTCHTTGVFHIKTSNPPQPCCRCLTAGFNYPINVSFPKPEKYIPLEQRIEKLEKHDLLSRIRILEDFKVIQDQVNIQIFDKLEKLEYFNKGTFATIHEFPAFKESLKVIWERIEKLEKTKESKAAGINTGICPWCNGTGKNESWGTVPCGGIK